MIATVCAAPTNDEDQWLEKADAIPHSADRDGVPDDVPGNHDGAVPSLNKHDPKDDDPTQLVATDTPCEAWCAANENSWTTKCTYKNTCAGCSQCATPITPCVDKSTRCSGWRNYCFAQSGKQYQVGGESLEIFCKATCTGCTPDPVPPPPPLPKNTGTFDCVAAKSVTRCGKCMGTDQCASGYCCPYMKKCVETSSTSCYYPIADCRPMCHKSTIADSVQDCSHCKNADFPSNWAGDTCK